MEQISCTRCGNCVGFEEEKQKDVICVECKIKHRSFLTFTEVFERSEEELKKEDSEETRNLVSFYKEEILKKEK